MSRLVEELKRRKVFRVAAVYAIAAWVLIQVADIVLPTFGAPDWVNQTIIFLFVLGFFPTLIAAWAYEVTPQGIRPDTSGIPQAPSTSSSDRKLIYAIFGLVLLVAGFQISDRFLIATDEPLVGETETTRTQNRAVTRVSVNIPEDQFFHPGRGDFDISDDGTLFVYRGIGESGQAQLWLRRWDELRGRPLRDSTGATRPNFSPNGQEIVFQSRGQIRVIPVHGGLSRTLIEGASDTPSWSPDGTRIYFRNPDGGISRISAMGGEAEEVRKLNVDNGDVDYQNPKVLPDGNRIIYTAKKLDDPTVIHAANLDTGEVKELARGKHPIYSSTGHLLFQALDEPTLLAARFDPDTLEITAAPVPLATGLLMVGEGNYANVGLSDTGRLVYRLGSNAGLPGTPVWVSRNGVATEIDPGWRISLSRYSAGLALSPQGDRLAIAIVGIEQFDIWVKRLDTGPLSRITFTGITNTNPTWSPDGESLIYSSQSTTTKAEIWSKKADGSGSAELLLEQPAGYFAHETSVSADGRWIVYRQRSASFLGGDIYGIDTQAGVEPLPLVVNEYFNHGPELSPDGKWLAYVSNESGQDEVYVRPFPDVDSGRWQLSSRGGSDVAWASSGKELFYHNGIGEMVAVQLSAGTTFDWDSQEVLFSATDYRSGQISTNYGVSPDAQRFVMIKLEAAENTELILVDNWVEDLR